MALKKWFIVMVGILSLSTSLAQEEIYARNGLLKATATIAPSTMLNRKLNNVYLSGFAEYFFEDHLSVRGDILWYVDGLDQQPKFYQQNTALYVGLFYHPNRRKNLDTYIGFEPGMMISRLNLKDAQNNALGFQAIPSVSLHSGLTFYVWKYFNFYLDIQYIHGNAINLPIKNGRTDEFIFSAGLGFQLNCKK